MHACIEILSGDPARRKSIAVASLAAAALLPGPAAAQRTSQSPHSFTANVGLYSQYIFRGLTQTNGKPALQGGVDYAHASGFYLGVWGSNVSGFDYTNTEARATFGAVTGALWENAEGKDIGRSTLTLGLQKTF